MSLVSVERARSPSSVLVAATMKKISFLAPAL